MNGKHTYRLGFALLTALLGNTAYAEVSADIGLATDYIREGIKTTGGNLTLQGGINGSHRWGFYAGLWGSTLNYKRNDRFAEWDAYAGWYLPVTNSLAFDVGATRHQFVGDDLDSDYDSWHIKLLAWDGLTLGYHRSERFFNGPFAHRRWELAYTYNAGEWSIEGYTAHHRYLDTDDEFNWGSKSRDDYWQFRFGLGRSHKQWNYTLTVDGTTLPGRFDGGLSINLGIHRQFDLF